MAMEYLRRKKRLGDMLLQERVITEEQLNEGLEVKKEQIKSWVKF